GDRGGGGVAGVGAEAGVGEGDGAGDDGRLAGAGCAGDQQDAVAAGQEAGDGGGQVAATGEVPAGVGGGGSAGGPVQPVVQVAGGVGDLPPGQGDDVVGRDVAGGGQARAGAGAVPQRPQVQWFP